jgi:regulator of sigma E protease
MAFHDPEPRAFLTPRMSPMIDTIVTKSTMEAGLKLR